MKRIAIKGPIMIALIIVGFMVVWVFWPRPAVSVIFDGMYTNGFREARPWILITNPLPYRINYAMLPKEVKSDVGWSQSEGLKVISATGKTYETGLIFGGETLEPRSGFRFIAGESTDRRPYRYPVLWGMPPEVATARPQWKRRLDELAVHWIGHPIFLPYGIVRSPVIIPQMPNQVGAAKVDQTNRSETNRTSSAAR
jgi:hypothetical protein